VGSVPIHFATITHFMVMKNNGEPVPDPPSYSACVARRKAAAAAKALEGAPQQSEAQLKEGCQKAYRELFEHSLSAATHNVWIAGEAREEGIHVSRGAVLHEFALSSGSFKTKAQFKAYLKSTGQTVAEMQSEIKLGKVSDEIFRRIKAKAHPATKADVAAYYAAHRQKYAIPEGRDVRILRTTSRASALNVVKELKSGKSFAQLAKQLSAIGQPIEAEHGLVKDLLPGVYEEKPLNDAIFSAKLNQLYGPLELKAAHKTIAPETNSGFFIFEVIKTIAPKQTPLGAVRNSIAEELTKADAEKTLSTAIAAIRAKWTARTDCAPEYVVRNCRQFKGAALADRFTL
jgi:foldase protein PrsA